MTDFTFLLAAGDLPMGESINPLLPKTYDTVSYTHLTLPTM